MHLLKVINLNQINIALRCEIKNTAHKELKSKQTESCRDDEITKKQIPESWIYVIITYSIKKERKIVRISIDKRKKKGVTAGVWEGEKERRERKREKN